MKKIFVSRGFVISSILARNYPFKLSNWRTRIRCDNCSRLRMKILERCRWRRSSVFIVKCEHISNFVLTVDFEQANVFWVHICYVVVFHVWTKFINNCIWTFTITTLRVNQWEIFAKEFTSDVDSGLKRSAHIQNDLLYICLKTERLIRSNLTHLILSCCKLLLSSWNSIAKLLNKNYF